MPPVARAQRRFYGMDRRLRRPIGTVSTLTAAVMTALYGARAFGMEAPAATDESALQEVVVTASRRAVSAQDLPISITAVTGAALDQAREEGLGLHDVRRKPRGPETRRDHPHGDREDQRRHGRFQPMDHQR